MAADVPPRNEGVLRLKNVDVQAGDTLHPEVTGANGWLADEYALPVRVAGENGRDGEVTDRKADDAVAAWRFAEESQFLLLRRGDVTVRIDRPTGKIVEAKIGEKPVLCGGPHWSFLPTFSKHQQRAMKGETPRLTPFHGKWECDSSFLAPSIRWTGSVTQCGRSTPTITLDVRAARPPRLSGDSTRMNHPDLSRLGLGPRRCEQRRSSSR